jgi:hypothetical protein
MYCLAVDYGVEGWAIYEYETLEEIKSVILSGAYSGNGFKIFKELKLEITESA